MKTIEEFMKDLPALSTEEAKRIVESFGATLVTWLLVWGDRYQIPPEHRQDAFFFGVDLGYRMAKRDMETDKWNKLLS